LPDARADQLLVAVHEYLAGSGAQLVISWQRADLSQQGVVGELLQFGARHGGVRDSLGRGGKGV
jgi:hypothetical protein